MNKTICFGVAGYEKECCREVQAMKLCGMQIKSGVIVHNNNLHLNYNNLHLNYKHATPGDLNYFV